MSELAKQDLNAATMEKAIIGGNLADLSPAERLSYYNSVCQSVGLNPLTAPFQYITLNGRLVLYAKRDATDQLRKLHKVSIRIVSREKIGDVYVVTAQATDSTGRIDESTGAVTLGKLQGDALANTLMKAETKAKRRVTLSICGLGMLDESEIETLPPAAVKVVNNGTPVEDDNPRRKKAEECAKSWCDRFAGAMSKSHFNRIYKSADLVDHTKGMKELGFDDLVKQIELAALDAKSRIEEGDKVAV